MKFANYIKLTVIRGYTYHDMLQLNEKCIKFTSLYTI